MQPCPRLALCIPAFNAESHLPRLLASARNQGVPFDEILVFDDCSTDRTSEVAREYGAKVVRSEANVGCSIGKNRLAELTACEWVHFHDADDDLYPNFVEVAGKWMHQSAAPDVVLFGYEYKDFRNGKLLATVTFDHDQLARDPVAYSISTKIVSICGLYNRASFLRAGGYDLDREVLYNEDAAMHCQLARAGLTFAADPTVTVINYRMGSSMSQSNQAKCAKARYHVLLKAAEQLNGKYSDEIVANLWPLAGVCGTYLDWETADAVVDLAVRLKGRVPPAGNLLFRALCLHDPHKAIRIRERWIRAVKPQLRSGRDRMETA